MKETNDFATPIDAGRKRYIACAIALVLCFVVWEIHRVHIDANVVMLLSADGAKWMRADIPGQTVAKFTPISVTRFESEFTSSPGFGGGQLRVTALRHVIVGIDQTEIFATGSQATDWRIPYEISIPLGLQNGRHRLWLKVTNDYGPAMVRVVSTIPSLQSAENWRADQGRAVVAADQIYEPAVESIRSSSWTDVLRVGPWLVGLFIGAFAVLLRCKFSQTTDWARRLRWALLLMFGGLAANNIFKVPLQCGYDFDGHYIYIIHVAEHWSLPKLDGGWQFFQAPFYYYMSAALCKVLTLIGVPNNRLLYLLRIIPLGSGMAMIEMAYRSGRIVFTHRRDLQLFTTLIGGLIPMNLYMAQTVSNEPLAAVTSAAVVLVSLLLLSESIRVRSIKFPFSAGVLLGVALLTKASALIWIVPMGWAVAVSMKRQRLSPLRCITALALITTPAMCIGGWFLVRSMLLVGTVEYPGPSSISLRWWQDPGYRTPSMFFRFGHVFQRPVFNGFASVWDSLYATLWGNGIPVGSVPWHFGLMSCCLWLSVFPTIAVGIGVVRAFVDHRNPSPIVRDGSMFCALAIGCFVIAILHVYLLLPIYSCAKASYMLGASPCIGLLAAAGADQLMRGRLTRAAAGALLLCWAVTAYLTYFAW